MQSHTATIFASTSRIPIGASGYNRNSRRPGPTGAVRHNISPISKPVSPALGQDFYLDTFFNLVWMSGPHVFSFRKDGTVVRPEGDRPEPEPWYRASVVSSRRRMDKPWKNIAITEQDDADFAAMQAEAKGKLMGRVYTWPPKPQPAVCEECAVLARPRRKVEAWSSSSAGRRGDKEDSLPSLSYGSSESDSEAFQVVPGKRNVVHRQDVAFEKSVGFERSLRKATGPLSPIGAEKDENARVRFGMAQEAEREDGDGVMSLLTTELWAEDQLTVKLKEILRMPAI